MKKTAIASLAVLASAATLATFALAGAGKFGNVQVDADVTEYSVTFDAESSTTSIEEPYDNGDYAICTTTAGGNKVGVVGFNKEIERLSFHGTNFWELHQADFSCALINASAIEFSAITGYKISFSGGSMCFMFANASFKEADSDSCRIPGAPIRARRMRPFPYRVVIAKRRS